MGLTADKDFFPTEKFINIFSKPYIIFARNLYCSKLLVSAFTYFSEKIFFFSLFFKLFTLISSNL